MNDYEPGLESWWAMKAEALRAGRSSERDQAIYRIGLQAALEAAGEVACSYTCPGCSDMEIAAAGGAEAVEAAIQRLIDEQKEVENVSSDK